MKARLGQATDPPAEEHRLTDGSGEWVDVAEAVGSIVKALPTSPEADEYFDKLAAGQRGEWVPMRRQTVMDIVEWTGPNAFRTTEECSACGEWADPEEGLAHADDCWWVELSKALGLEP